MFTASDLADLFDKWNEEYWEQQDDWLIQSQQVGDAHPVFVFASWYNNRIATAPQRLIHWLAGGIVDVLRLGSDIETDSGWGIAKGAFLNLTRLAVVAGPAARLVGAGSRYAGLLATAALESTGMGSAPCRFVAVNNALSAVRGKTVQLFASLDDIVNIRGTGAPGANMVDEILRHPSVAPLIKEAGVVWKDLGNMASVREAFVKAAQVEGALVIGLRWVNRQGRTLTHRVTLVKDALGNIKILDYSSGATFRGFSSLREMGAARAGWDGMENAVLRPGVLLFQSNYLRFLDIAGDAWHLGLPVAMGLSWGKGKDLDTAAADIASSLWKFLKAKLGFSAPPPPPVVETTPPPPVQAGPPPEAKNAPRPDWLTGVQYRLKYLAYYNGPVNGVNDRATKDAVIHFQTDQRLRIDAIPGPKTQAELVSVCGF